MLRRSVGLFRRTWTGRFSSRTQELAQYCLPRRDCSKHVGRCGWPRSSRTASEHWLKEMRSIPTDIFNPEWLGKDPTADPVLASYFLFHDCDLDTLQWALTTLRLFAPSALYADTVALLPRIPSTYIVATGDRTLRPDWCRRAARQRLGAEIIDIDAGHCPHVSRPHQVADILDRLASAPSHSG